MNTQTFNYIKKRVYLVHAWLIQAGEMVSSEQFVHIFSSDAPPLGWHLWHMARFTDRLQAKLNAVQNSELGAEIWYQEAVAKKWHLEPENLGVFETGMGQSHADARNTIINVGQPAVIDYAQAVFEVCNTTLAQLTDSDMPKTYFGILDYAYDNQTGRVWASEPKESVIVEDLVFHLTHRSRHAGMMEALRGLMGSAGTLSV